MTDFTPNRVRFLYFLNKLDSLSHEEFFRYWSHEHADIFLAIPSVQKNILKYEQLHLNAEVKAKIKAASPIPIPDYDGVVVFEAESLEKMFEVMKDPEYTSKVLEDGKKLFNLENGAIGFYQIATILNELPSDNFEPGVTRKDNVRVLASVHKKPDMDFAAFSKYWKDENGRGFAELMKGKGHNLKYEQLHKLEVEVKVNVDKADGVSFIESTNWENILGPFSAPEFTKWSQEEIPKYANPSQGLGLFPVNVVTFISK